jgi:tRNA 2-thiouridine synthesizing protein A
VTKLTKADVVLDVSGEVCPLLLIKTRKALDKMKKGEVLEVIINDEKAKTDITMAVKELGMQLERIAKDKDEKWRMLIRKNRQNLDNDLIR